MAGPELADTVSCPKVPTAPLDQGDWATCVANAMVRVVQDVMMLKYNTCIDEKGLRTYTAVAAGAWQAELVYNGIFVVISCQYHQTN